MRVRASGGSPLSATLVTFAGATVAAQAGVVAGEVLVTPTSAGVTYGTPALTLGAANAGGSIAEAIRRDATILAFDATAPTTQALGDAAAVGTAAVAARRDHKHGMPAFDTPAIALGTAAAAGSAATPIRSDATILAFDATVPSTQALGDAAAVGVATVAARRDHKHALPSFATPAIVLGTAAAGGAAATPIRSDATVVAFDTTVPVTQAFSDAAATGSAAVAARRDHVHGMPASSVDALTLISDQTVAGSVAASITFSSISGSYKHLYLVWQVRLDGAEANLLMRLNADTGAHYDFAISTLAATFISGAGSQSQTSLRVGTASGTGNPANGANGGRIWVPNYAVTTYFKNFHSEHWRQDASNTSFVEVAAGHWRDTSVVTSITLLPASSNFAIGSRVTLYGES